MQEAAAVQEEAAAAAARDAAAPSPVTHSCSLMTRKPEGVDEVGGREGRGRAFVAQSEENLKVL